MRVWVASLIFYSFVFLVCEVLRFLIITLIPNPKRLTTQLLLEFVGTLQICTPMFDVGTVMDTYGLWGVFIEITVIELANCYFMRDSVANPCPIITCCYRRSKAVRRAVYVFFTQLAAAYVSYFFARMFWRLNVHPLHAELLEANTCSADLTVALTVGCAIEGLTTFVAKAFEHYSGQYSDNETYTSIANCVFSGFLCALGITYTGSYGNPIVAWACTFNCEGVSHIGHLVVYWLSPLIGWYLAEMVFGSEDQEVLAEEVEAEKKKE